MQEPGTFDGTESLTFQMFFVTVVAIQNSE